MSEHMMYDINIVNTLRGMVLVGWFNNGRIRSRMYPDRASSALTLVGVLLFAIGDAILR